MSLLTDILAWSEERLPAWQQDALRRLFQKNCELEDSDFDELFALLKLGNNIAVQDPPIAEPLSSQHLPSASSSGNPTVVLGMKDLVDVNRLAGGQELSFAPKGITVVYGENASGKSGYARVLKRACRARDGDEAVLPDARKSSGGASVPRATITIEKGASSTQLTWAEGSVPPTELAEVSVFDSRCARLYLTAEQEVAYLPYGLDIVESLADQVIPQIEARLKEAIESLDVDLTRFDRLRTETAVGKLLDGLSAKTRSEDIEALAQLTEAEEKRLEFIAESLSESDPGKRASELRASATRIKELIAKIERAASALDEEVVTECTTLHETAQTALAAEEQAASRLRAGDGDSGEELLPGTGGAVWKTLYEAARKYSVEVAYPQASFPNTSAGARCPLCQQPISESAADRLVRFDQHIREDVAKQAREGRARLAGRITELKGTTLDFEPGAALRQELSGLDAEIAGEIDAFKEALSERKKRLLESMQGEEWTYTADSAQSPRARLRSLAASQLWKMRGFAKAAVAANRSGLEAEKRELAARSELAEQKDALLETVSRLQQRAALEKCRDELKTRPISDKSKALANTAVTDSLGNALNSEFAALGVPQVKVKLQSRTTKGKVRHRLVLDLPANCDLSDILSEGEQRAIAIASFLAEMGIAGHAGGVIFDDPVSSLDHWHREKVADRLVVEARTRQVIVFTHDTTFLQQLRDAIERAATPSAVHTLEWRDDAPGFVTHGLPWEQQGYAERIDALEKRQRTMQAIPWPQYPNSAQKKEMAQAYSDLRATIERVTQDLVFCGVVRRFSDWVRVSRLAPIEQAEVAEILRLDKRCSDVTEAHDPAMGKNATVPTAKEFGDDIADLRKVIDTIKAKRKAASP